MDEFIKAIDAEAEATEQAQTDALAEWERQEAARKNAIARRADAKILLRALAFAGLNWGLIAAGRAGWIAPVLWGIVLMLGFAWFGFHAGAWFQFRFGKEDKCYG